MRLHDFLDYQAQERPHADCAVQGARRVTYQDAAAHTNQLANALVHAGINAGERIAFLGKNSIEHALMFFGASKAGVVPVPLNYRLAPPEWQYIITDAQAQALLVAAEFVPAIESLRKELGGVRLLIAIDAPDRPPGWEDYHEW